MSTVKPEFNSDMDVSDIEKALVKFGEAISEIEKLAKQPTVLFLGHRGAGTTTIVNQLLGVKYHKEIVEMENESRLRSGEKTVEFAISGQQTQVPRIYFNKEQTLSYCDAPGYPIDDAEQEERLYHDLSSAFVINQATGVKGIVIVIDWHAIQIGRGNIFRKVLQQLGQIFRDRDSSLEDEFGQIDKEVANSIYFVFTKVDPKLSKDQVLHTLAAYLKRELGNQELNKKEKRKKELKEELKLLMDKSGSVDQKLFDEMENIEKDISIYRGTIKILMLTQLRPDNVFLHDKEGRLEVDRLNVLLQKSQVIAPNALNGYFENPSVEDISRAALKLLKSKSSLSKEYSEHKKRFDNVSDEISRLKNEASPENLQKKIESAKKEKKDELDVVCQQLNSRKQLLLDEMKSQSESKTLLEKKRDELDTKEVSLHKSERLSVKAQPWLKAAKGIFVYSGSAAAGTLVSGPGVVVTGPVLAPLCDIASEAILHRFFREEACFVYKDIPFHHVELAYDPSVAKYDSVVSSNPSEGRYSLTYRPEGTDAGWVEVKVFAESRYIHKARIDALTKEITDLVGLQKRKRDDILEIENNITKRERLITELEKSVTIDNMKKILENELIAANGRLKKEKESMMEVQGRLENKNEEISHYKLFFEFMTRFVGLLQFRPNSNAHKFLNELSKESFKDGIVEKSKVWSFIHRIKLGKGGDFFQQEGILKATLPGGEEIEFEEFKARGDGNCGFYVLGVSRQELVEVLLPHSVHDTLRTKIFAEMYEAFIGNSLGVAPTKRWAELYQQYFDLQQVEDGLTRQSNTLMRRFEHNAKGLNMGELVNYFKSNKEKKEYQAMLKILEQHQESLVKLKNEISEYLRSKEAYEGYVNTLGKRGYLGYATAKLIAELKGFTIYIWVKADHNPKQLVLKDSHVDPKSCHIIHMLHTDKYTHFNLLAKSEKLESSQRNPETSSKPISHIETKESDESSEISRQKKDQAVDQAFDQRSQNYMLTGFAQFVSSQKWGIGLGIAVGLTMSAAAKRWR